MRGECICEDTDTWWRGRYCEMQGQRYVGYVHRIDIQWQLLLTTYYVLLTTYYLLHLLATYYLIPTIYYLY